MKSNKELYQRTFSKLHSSREIRWEDMQRMHTKKQHGKRLLAVLAAVVALAVLSAAAVAADFFGLRELLLPQKMSVGVLDENGVLKPGQTQEVDCISLSGYMDTPESLAMAQWQAFLEGYDQDESIIRSIGNAPTGFEDKYGMYLVYTQEMADKLDEIVKQYNLKLHQQIAVVYPDEWQHLIGPFFTENVTPYSGYLYEDGTFAFDGEAQLPAYGKVDYQFRRSVRGSFHDVMLNIGDISQYQDWTYRTADGQEVTLAVGETRSLILADLGDSFVTLTVLAGNGAAVDDVFSSGPLSTADLESLAGCFDFAALTPVQTPNPAVFQSGGKQGGQDSPTDEWESDPLYQQTGLLLVNAEEYVRNLCLYLREDDRESVASLLTYPREVTVSTGTYTVQSASEFLPYYDELITADLEAILTALESEELFSNDGMIGAGNGLIWFAKLDDESVRIFTIQNNHGCRSTQID